ncbi:MAG: CHASE domain-containing protein [Pseudomonadota bacterium]
MTGTGAHKARAFFSRRNGLAWAVLAIALLADLAAWQHLRDREIQAAQRQFDLLAGEISGMIEQRLHDHEQILLGGAGLFDASLDVDRREWQRYTERLKLGENYPGIQGVGFTRILGAEERAAFESEVRAEGFPAFQLRPPGERARYAAVYYLEPLDERNRAALGFDMLSEPTRRAAMLEAAETGETRISGKVTLVQETHGQVQPGLLMYVPLYRPGQPLDSPAQRMEALRGFVFSPYRTYDLIAGILAGAPPKLEFALYAGTQVQSETLLFRTGEPHRPLFVGRQQLSLYGQTWTLEFSSPPAFEASLHDDRPLLLLGLGVCLLLFALTSLLALRREQAEALARKMTERIRQSSQALSESEERQRLVLKGSNDGWWDVDLGTGDFFASARGWEMLGHAPSEQPNAAGRWQQAVHPEDLPGLQLSLGQAMASQVQAFQHEVRLLHRDGHALAVLLRAFILRDGEGHPQRVSGTIMDLTERKRIEQMKSEFVSTVSHELRTPLTSIAGSLGLINGGALGEVPAAMRQMLDIAHQNCLRLNHLINDLLDMDKLVANQMTFDLDRHDLAALLEESLTSNQAYADQHGVGLLGHACPPIEVRVDARRLQQVLTNLLSNAIKFSPSAAQVQLRAQTRGNWVRVSVSDQGTGIPEAFRARIFQKFSQADATDRRQVGGTGLGLAISKELVERMGGRIGFDSPAGQGATFWFELPILDNPAVSAWESGHQADVLVVEDEPDIAHLLQQLLTRAGYRVVLAASLGQARDLLATQDFAALTLDLRLPDGNGLELIRELRANEATRALPVLVISAACEQGRLSLQGGFRAIDWLDKPIDAQRLLASLGHALHGLPPKARVLHIEDDHDLRQVIAEQGRELARFIGANSLAQARMRLSEQSFDLILLDLGLPDGNGLELLDLLHHQHPGVPVVVLSAQELTAEQLGQVEAALAKSRTDTQHFLELLSRLLPQASRDA